jgi:hypothetical protein
MYLITNVAGGIEHFVTAFIFHPCNKFYIVPLNT